MSDPTTALPMSPPDCSRSEAFPEDLPEFDPPLGERRRPPRWFGLMPLLPVLVALAGVAFAVLPPA